MGDIFLLALSPMRASLLKLDLAFLRPLISFVAAMVRIGSSIWSSSSSDNLLFICSPFCLISSSSSFFRLCLCWYLLGFLLQFFRYVFLFLFFFFKHVFF
ncbi:unnamed protein product [Prunus armeniaca]